MSKKTGFRGLLCLLLLAWGACDGGGDGVCETPVTGPCPEPDTADRGAVTVALTVTGELDLDRDGVAVTIGDRSRIMEAGQHFTFTMFPGDYPIVIEDVKGNCRIESADGVATIVAGETSQASITVACDPMGPAELRVEASLASYSVYGDPDIAVPDGDLRLGCQSADGGLPDDCASVLIDFAGIREAVEGRQVKSAYLRMYLTEFAAGQYAGSAEYEVAPVLGKWDKETGIDGRPEPGGVAYHARPPQALSEPMEWNVTTIVRQWADGTLAPYGLLLQDGMTSPYMEGNRSSSDHAPNYAYDNVVTLESEDSFVDPVHCPHLYIVFE